MLKSAKILKEMDALVATAEHENRAMTDAEIAEFDRLKADHAKAIADEAAEAERNTSETAARRASLEAAHTEADRAATERTIAPANATRRPVRAGGAPAVRTFEAFGEFLHAVRFNPNDQRLSNLWNDQVGAGVAAEQRMDDGALGGFMVPQQFRQQLLRVDAQEAIIRPRATVIPAGTPPDSTITMPALDQREAVGANNVFGGMTFGKVAEGGVKSDTGTKFREVSLQPQEWAGVITVTDKLLRNWQASGAFLEREMRVNSAAYEDFQFFRGNGVGGPLGVINSPAAYVVARETAGDFTFADYKEMVSRLMPGGSPVWVIALDARPKVMSLRNLEGSPAVGDGSLLFIASVVPGAPDTLGGYPIIWYTRAPAAASEAGIGLYDFSKYLIKDGSGPFVAASEHVNFTSNKTVFKIFGNHDGQSWLTEPFKTEGGYLVSPFVLLGA